MYYVAYGQPPYLAHHGILGQKWGVRRFQPYGSGYDRKGGKTGKVVGDLRRTLSERRAQKRDRTLNAYKARESKRIDSEIAKLNSTSRKKTRVLEDRYKGIAAAANRAQVRRYNKGMGSDLTEAENKMIGKRLDQYKKAELRYNLKKGELEATRSVLMNYTYKDMVKEASSIGTRQGINYGLFGIGGLPLNALTRQSMVDSYRLKQVDKGTKEKISANAERKASMEAKDMAKSRDGYSAWKKRNLRRAKEIQKDREKYGA